MAETKSTEVSEKESQAKILMNLIRTQQLPQNFEAIMDKHLSLTYPDKKGILYMNSPDVHVSKAFAR